MHTLAVAPLFEDLGHALSTDYFFLREDLTDEQLGVLRRVREFADDEVLPVIGGYWERAELPWPLIYRLGELGIVGEDMQGYGCPGLDPISCGLAHMELSRGDGSLGTVFGVQSGLAMKSIYLFGSEAQKQRWLPAMARLEKLGADFHAVTRRALRECVPWLSSERSALWTTEDWRLSPRDALTALRAGAQSKGARWIEASVTGFEPGRADLSDGGFVDCDALVIATGASGSLCGLAGELNLLTPIKGQILRWPALSLSGPVVRLKGTYICPSPQGVTVGATMEPGRDDLDIDPSAVATLRAGASAVIPALASGPVEARAGVRAATPDGLPLVGPSDRPGVWLAVGARRNGWLLAPLIARIMADMLAGVTPDSRAALFDPARFT